MHELVIEAQTEAGVQAFDLILMDFLKRSAHFLGEGVGCWSMGQGGDIVFKFRFKFGF